MRRADRLFRIVQLLRGRRPATTAAQLAEQLEVSERTVYRDVRDLMLAARRSRARPASATAAARLRSAAADVRRAKKSRRSCSARASCGQFGDPALARAQRARFSTRSKPCCRRTARRCSPTRALFVPRHDAARSAAELSLARARSRSRRSCRFTLRERRRRATERTRVARSACSSGVARGRSRRGASCARISATSGSIASRRRRCSTKRSTTSRARRCATACAIRAERRKLLDETAGCQAGASGRIEGSAGQPDSRRRRAALVPRRRPAGDITIQSDRSATACHPRGLRSAPARRTAR